MPASAPGAAAPASPLLEPPILTPPATQKAAWTALVLWAAAIALAALAPAWAPTFQGTAYVIGHFGALAALWAIWRARPDPRVVLIGACLAAVLLIPAPAFTSHDVERYLWDGAVARVGADPWRVHPDASDIKPLRAIWPTPAEHGLFPSLYPPAAMALFAFCAGFGPVGGFFAWKTMIAGAVIASVLIMRSVIADVARDKGAQGRWLALAALNPLVVLETGVGGHLDAFVMLSITVALLAWRRGWPGLAGAALGLGATIKLLPIVLLGPLFLVSGLRRGLVMATISAWTILLIYGLTFALGFQPIGSLPNFFEKWRGGAPLFAVVSHVAPAHFVGLVQAGLGVFLLGIAALIARIRPVAAMILALAAPLLISPIGFAWYALALAPLAALPLHIGPASTDRQAGLPSAALWSWMGLAPFSYEVLDRFNAAGHWAPADWPIIVLGSGLALGFSLDVARLVSRRKSACAKNARAA